MDLAIEELPTILNAKVDIDASIQKVNIQIGQINTMRRQVLDSFEIIEGELLKEEEMKNITDEEKEELGEEEISNSAIVMVTAYLLLIF